MALSDLKQTKNKWALLAYGRHAFLVKLGPISHATHWIPVEESYQTVSEGATPEDVKTIYFDSVFDKKSVVCRKNIADWLEIFYPSLRRVI